MTGGWGVDGRYRSPAWSGSEAYFMVFGTWPLSMYTRSGCNRCRAAAPAPSKVFPLPRATELMAVLAGAHNLRYHPNGSTRASIIFPHEHQIHTLWLYRF